jgi:hypothetical protein
MMHRLKGTLKDDLEALRAGTTMPEDPPKKTSKSTPRKRKIKDASANGDAEVSPSKKGRKKETSPEPAEDGEELQYKMEVVDEEVHVKD